MSEAKRRQKEIAELQAKGPKERKRLKRQLGLVKTEIIDGRTIKHMTTVEIEPTATPQPAKPITLVTGRKLDLPDFFVHALAMADITKGRGFRQPSANPKNFKSTSLMEKLSIKMGISKPRTGPERSERGDRKHTARIEAKARIILDRLIEQYPDRTAKAKNEERMANWFTAATFEALSQSPNKEWLANLVNQRIKEGPRAPKYLHANSKDWAAYVEKMAA